MTKVVAPRGLGAAGGRLWREVTAKYELRVDEAAVLEKACRASDRIGVLEEALSASMVMVKGSMGQPVVNPLVAEIRKHESLVASLLARLRLPDEPAEGASGEGSRSTQARAAAQSRWDAAHGKGA